METQNTTSIKKDSSQISNIFIISNHSTKKILQQLNLYNMFNIKVTSSPERSVLKINITEQKGRFNCHLHIQKIDSEIIRNNISRNSLKVLLKSIFKLEFVDNNQSTPFVYKEDVDLAYRFMHIGAKSIVIPAATAVHHRTFRKSLLHKGISDYNAYHSYKNHWWNLLTHISVWTFIKRSWAIIPFEIAKAVFIGSKHPKMLLHLIYDTFTHAKELRQKRGYFMSYESRR